MPICVVNDSATSINSNAEAIEGGPIEAKQLAKEIVTRFVLILMSRGFTIIRLFINI
jgi:hypothetical protein